MDWYFFIGLTAGVIAGKFFNEFVLFPWISKHLRRRKIMKEMRNRNG